ncbi:MAG TPA: dienelactone hydrolase family protein [Acidimicrobiales bacterium]
MGEIVEFPSNGGTASGYLAVPDTGVGIPLVIIQEWWGLVPHIKEVADRFAADGFVALVPDLYHGATTTEPDEAGKLMMAMNLEQAGKDMAGAVDEVARVSGKPEVGVTGFCMGGGLALILATLRPDRVKAVVPWYGLIPWPNAQPDWARLEASVLGHYAENDEYFTPELARELEQTLRDLGKDATINVHPGTQHAFFNDHRPEVHDPEASAAAYQATVEFLKEKLS